MHLRWSATTCVGRLAFTDIEGPESGSSKQDAGHLGQLGYAVLLLDLHQYSVADVATHSSVVDFPEVNHGWVNRGNLEQPEVKAAVAKAWHTALKFIQTVAPQQ